MLITEYNDLGSQRFYDPRSKQSFKYDHLRKEAQDYEPYEPDAMAEPWRSALQEEISAYTESHYRRGACSVFAKSQGGELSVRGHGTIAIAYSNGGNICFARPTLQQAKCDAIDT